MSADDRFEDEHGAALMLARFEVAADKVAEGVMLAAAGLRESTPYNAWQPMAKQFHDALDNAPTPAALMQIARQAADRLAVALIELAQHGPQA